MNLRRFLPDTIPDKKTLLWVGSLVLLAWFVLADFWGGVHSFLVHRTLLVSQSLGVRDSMLEENLSRIAAKNQSDRRRLGKLDDNWIRLLENVSAFSRLFGRTPTLHAKEPVSLGSGIEYRTATFSYHADMPEALQGLQGWIQIASATPGTALWSWTVASGTTPGFLSGNQKTVTVSLRVYGVKTHGPERLVHAK